MLDLAAPQVIQPTEALGRHEHHQCGCYPAWGVIQTHPQAEFWATANLKRQGYTTYLPLYPARRRDRVLRTLTRIVQLPLFPSYAFVQISPDDPWYPIRRTTGVRQLFLSDFGKPHIVRAGAVEAIINAEAARNALHGADGFAATEPLWTPGTPCSLAVGPLAGTSAVVLATGQDMVLVSLMLFGELREVAVDANCLVPREEV